jgi:hypothetical protein
MWVKVGEFASGGFLISKSTWYGVYDEMSLGMSTALYDNYIYFARDNTFFFAGGDEPNCCGWYHVVLTSDENQSRFYINGTLVEEGAGIVTATKSANHLWIGNFNAEGAYGQDIIFDEVRIYNRTLSYDDVEELFEYNGTTPPTTTTTIPPTSTTIFSVTGDITLNTKISYSVCMDNMTLKNAYTYTNGTDIFEKNQVILCDYGCVHTGNFTAECRPTPLNVTSYFIIGVMLLFGSVIFIIGYARRH